jgi:hypothetical protein
LDSDKYLSYSDAVERKWLPNVPRVLPRRFEKKLKDGKEPTDPLKFKAADQQCTLCSKTRGDWFLRVWRQNGQKTETTKEPASKEKQVEAGPGGFVVCGDCYGSHVLHGAWELVETLPSSAVRFT